MKMDQSINVIHVGCHNCSRPHLTKNCDLDENGNWKDQGCYSSGDMYDEDWRKPKKEWLPYDGYKKEKRRSTRNKFAGIIKRSNQLPKRRMNLK